MSHINIICGSVSVDVVSEPSKKSSRFKRVIEKPSDIAEELPHFQAPKILEAFPDIEVRVGERAMFSVYIAGTPPPEVGFFVNGKSIVEGDTKYEVRLIIALVVHLNSFHK